jgi:acetoacetate decarboxylase
VRSQYKESFVVVRCRYEGTFCSRCVFIWVDKDFALMRGYLQSYPKKLGSINQTRPITVGPASSNGFVNGHAMLHHRWFPRIELDGVDSLSEFVTMSGVNVELGPVLGGGATIELFDSPTEELVRLAPREIIGGYFRSVGTTFASGTTLHGGT